MMTATVVPVITAAMFATGNPESTCIVPFVAAEEAAAMVIVDEVVAGVEATTIEDVI
jgi:hypothetical protein